MLIAEPLLLDCCQRAWNFYCLTKGDVMALRIIGMRLIDVKH